MTFDDAGRRRLEAQKRLGFMFDRAPSFMALLSGPEHIFEIANPAYLAIVGDRPIIGLRVADALPDAAAQGYVDILDRVYATALPYSTSGSHFRQERQPGGPVVDLYLDFVYQPMIDENGLVEGIFVEGFDVTARVLQVKRQDALIELGDRIRDLDEVPVIAQTAAEIVARVIGASRAGFGTVDAARETVLMHPNWCAEGVEPVTGLHHFRDYGSFIEDLKAGRPVIIGDVAKDPRTSESAEVLHAIGISVLVNVPILEHGVLDLVVFAHYPQARELSNEDLDFIRQVGDRAQASISRASARRHQNVLNQELSHRLKNTLAMVQAIASRTLKGLADEPAVHVFMQRLHALASAHNVLLQQNWSGAPVADVVGSALASMEAVDRLDIDGPPLHLGARVALSMSLLLHELGTNALKYGALSNSDGTVEIRWWSEVRDGVDSFVFRWTEKGGPGVSARTGRGFGSRLIEMGLMGSGHAQMDFRPEGLVAELTAPLERIGDM